MPKTEPYYAIVPPGFEEIAHRELLELSERFFPHLKIESTERGGIAFQARRIEAMLLHLHARTLHRVLLRVASFRAKAFPKVFQKASKVSWKLFVRPNTHVTLKASAHTSRLMHSKRLEKTVLSAIAAQIPVQNVTRSDSKAEHAQQILVRIVDDQCTISVDLSGALLHRRGYRQETGRAPLRETHACALLRAAGWSPDQALLDPMCGSGTFTIEAALMQRDKLHLPTRPFAFESWPDTHTDAWSAQRAKHHDKTPSKLPASPTLFARDRVQSVIDSAARNADRAGVRTSIDLSTFDATQLDPAHYPKTGLIVCNLPYGKRLGSERTLKPVYAAFAKRLKLFQGWRVLLLWTQPKLHKVLCAGIGAPPRETFKFHHGGATVHASLWDMKA